MAFDATGGRRDNLRNHVSIRQLSQRLRNVLVYNFERVALYFASQVLELREYLSVVVDDVLDPELILLAI